MDEKTLINFIIAILIAGLTAYLAKERGRSPVNWFFIGLLFGILGFIALFFFPIMRLEENVQLLPEKAQEGESALKGKLWFYLDSLNAQQGPVPFTTLEALWKEGKIGDGTYVWCEGMGQWKKIGEELAFKQLFA